MVSEVRGIKFKGNPSNLVRITNRDVPQGSIAYEDSNDHIRGFPTPFPYTVVAKTVHGLVSEDPRIQNESGRTGRSARSR